MRKAVLLVLVGVIAAAIFAGPVSSGAIFLLLPSRGASEAVALPLDYQPLHKGSIDLGTGLYSRVNEDLVVPGAPGLVLRRTYLSGYRVAKQFGIGTTHDGEQFLIGDGERFQWVSLILANGARINFKRVTSGASLLNAMFVHEETATEWQGARLGWTGFNWALRKQDGSLLVYQGCGDGTICSIIRARDGAGQTIHYRRDPSGRLVKMDDGGERWIAFDYDPRGRISRARNSANAEVRYDYDDRGRLERAVSTTGGTRTYGYSDHDELATIDEPGTSIENRYENGRCTHQVNRYPDAEPITFTFAYHLEGERIVSTHTTRSDGSWTRYFWGPDRHATAETHGRAGIVPAEFTYERDPITKAVTAFSVTCPDRRGRPLRHSAVVRPGLEDEVRENLLTTHCYWTRPARPALSLF